MIKILPADYPSLGECVIASLRINGPMMLSELYQSLPQYKREYVYRALTSIPHTKNGRLIEFVGKE